MMSNSTANLVDEDPHDSIEILNRQQEKAPDSSCAEKAESSSASRPIAPRRTRFFYGATDNAPPNYQEHQGDPPSYDTLVARLKRAKEEETSAWSFIKILFAEIFASILWTIVLFILVVLPIVMLVIGSKYINDCPRQPSIPVMLIVGGALMVISNLMNLGDRFHRMNNTAPRPSITVVGGVTALLNCLAMGWFIAGCVWVYTIYLPSFDSDNKSHYCHPVLYYFAFWLMNAFYIFFGILFVIGFLGLCCALC